MCDFLIRVQDELEIDCEDMSNSLASHPAIEERLDALARELDPMDGEPEAEMAPRSPVPLD